MGFLTGTGNINIHNKELINLLVHGLKAQATLNDSESVLFDCVDNHTVFLSEKNVPHHTFSCILLRNGTVPSTANVTVDQVSIYYYIGTIIYQTSFGDNMSEGA